MLEHDFQWTSTGSSGGLTAVQLPFPPTESVLYAQASTLALLSTQSYAFQTAQQSSGPWVIENSTTLPANDNGGAQSRIRVTGPYPWMRPFINSASTGTYTFRLLAVR